MMHSGFWYLLVIALEHTIWGFCCYKPLWETQWWKTHSPCSKAWSWGWKTPPTSFYTHHISTYRFKKVAGSYCSRVCNKGASLSRGEFDPADQEILWAFRHLGFTCRGPTIILKVFLESYHHQIFSFRLGRLGGKRMSNDLVFLRSRETYLESESETSSTRSLYPDLHSWGVSGHLEAFLIRAELPRVPGIQEGTTSFEDSVFGGVCLSISAWDFRRGLLLPRSIFWRSLDSFGVFLQWGRIIEGFSYLLERGIFQTEELGIHMDQIYLP